jgi:hypothetical protein
VLRFVLAVRRIMCLDNDPDELHRMQELCAFFAM